MSETDVVSKMFVAAHGDPIRIVPLNVGDTILQATEAFAAAAPALPRLTYRNGPLITNVEVFTIFWGPGWQQAPNSALVTQINQFFEFILTSALIDQMHEYSVPGRKVAHGKRIGSIMIATPKLHASVTDAAVQHMLQHEITTNAAVPKPTPNTLYFVYLEPGVKVVQGGAASCQAFCGYHSDISGQIFYAAMPFPGCAGCRGGLPVFDAITSTSSHELCEAITDPIPGQGWYDDAHGEIGDICAWKTKKIGQYVVQLEWSNHAGKCI
ncbi:MAG: hypothetical protein DMF93_01450 [Acidobacteria bacterium]|nr:MAG: hypothetical protein DMF93_01450 [Acidobacteriota bacterium]